MEILRHPPQSSDRMGCALEAEVGGDLIVICLEGLHPEGQEMLQLTGNRLYNELMKGGM